VNADDVALLAGRGLSGLPLCTADFNSDGATGVADIFSYLNNWFAGYPAADINDDQRVTVQDIFGFLGAWFSGCP
jgi:hypothetical protein